MQQVPSQRLRRTVHCTDVTEQNRSRRRTRARPPAGQQTSSGSSFVHFYKVQTIATNKVRHSYVCLCLKCILAIACPLKKLQSKLQDDFLNMWPIIHQQQPTSMIDTVRLRGSLRRTEPIRPSSGEEKSCIRTRASLTASCCHVGLSAPWTVSCKRCPNNLPSKLNLID